MDDLRLEEAVDGLGQGIAVSDAAHRGFDSGAGQALGVANEQVLRAAVRENDAVQRAHCARILDGQHHFCGDCQQFARAWHHLISQSMQFVGPVRPGDTVHAEVDVKELIDGRHRVV